MTAQSLARLCMRLLGLVFVAGCLTVAAPSVGEAASAAVINADADATLHSFVRQYPGAQELGNKAAGVLIFPSLLKAGFGFGGEYGERTPAHSWKGRRLLQPGFSLIRFSNRCASPVRHHHVHD